MSWLDSQAHGAAPGRAALPSPRCQSAMPCSASPSRGSSESQPRSHGDHIRPPQQGGSELQGTEGGAGGTGREPTVQNIQVNPGGSCRKGRGKHPQTVAAACETGQQRIEDSSAAEPGKEPLFPCLTTHPWAASKYLTADKEHLCPF